MRNTCTKALPVDQMEKSSNITYAKARAVTAVQHWYFGLVLDLENEFPRKLLLSKSGGRFFQTVKDCLLQTDENDFQHTRSGTRATLLL